MQPPPETATLAARLRERAAGEGDRRAFVYLGEGNREEESLDHATLHHLACVLSRELRACTVPGDRVLLMFPSGLAFVVAFFACHYAGLVPVPVVPPAGRRVRDAVASVAHNCGAALALTGAAFESQTRAFIDALPSEGRRLALRTLDLAAWQAGALAQPARQAETVLPGPDATAFIQYTSGSTSSPKGVVVTHRHLLANLQMMATAFRNDRDSTHVGWAPLYHDMGLIANVLQPFYVGALAVLMSPRRFAQEPWLWLKAISDWRARVSGGPNFAYDLCVQRRDRALAQGLDLRCWALAFNSAEPVQAATLAAFTQAFEGAGFRETAFYPCYGLADATLLVTGGEVDRLPVLGRFSKAALELARAAVPADPADERVLVGAGSALAGETVLIVDPAGPRRLDDGEIGEIWVGGPNVPAQYWQAPEASRAGYGNTLAEFPGMHFLATGDLGFLRGGELFITGRLKDMFVVRGRNIYPQDVECIGEAAAPGLRSNANAAFSVVRDGTESIVLVQEVHRTARNADTAAAVAAIRRAVYQQLDITLADVVMVDPGTVPKTSSGKVRRAEARRRYLCGELQDCAEPAA
jgi:acyl-CoA synthetase (AMP-forming)/AMP-acid ligase II